jgi:hypothetical protein
MSSPLPLGQTIPHYRLVQKLGDSGKGVAHHPRTHNSDGWWRGAASLCPFPIENPTRPISPLERPYSRRLNDLRTRDVSSQNSYQLDI